MEFGLPVGSNQGYNWMGKQAGGFPLDSRSRTLRLSIFLPQEHCYPPGGTILGYKSLFLKPDQRQTAHVIVISLG